METARAFWHLDDLLEVIVERVVEERCDPATVIDNLGTIRLRPEEQWPVLREGLRSLANSRRGMRGFRSGKVQSSGVTRRPLMEESAGLEEWADRILARLVFEAADGAMKPVTEFTHDDATAAYERRVRAVREQADREDPFWAELMDATASGWVLGRRSADVRKRLARLAVEARLTREDG